MTRNEALAWCVDRLDGWPTEHAGAPVNAPAGWKWGKEPPLPHDAPQACPWKLYDPSHKFGPITLGDVLNRRNHPPEPTAHPAMTRAQALEWVAEQFNQWPPGGLNAPPRYPTGWEWVLSTANNWYLKNTTIHGEAILAAHWRDARNIRDLNSIGKARAMRFQACGVSADIGHRVRLKIAQGEFTGTLAGVHGERVWIVDCSGAITGMAIPRISEITGFARVTDRDEFIDRAVDVMFKGNPAMSKHVARSSAVSMWNAGARFTDQGDE